MRTEIGFLIFDFSFPLSLLLTLLLFSCNQSKKESTTKFTNYYRQGELLYTKHCSNCHQATGGGLGRVYPPVNNSDFMDKNFKQVICLIKNGFQGEMIVNEENYNQGMPGIPSLTDIEVAEIATYIYNSWTNNRGIVEVKEVTSILNQCETSP